MAPHDRQVHRPHTGVVHPDDVRSIARRAVGRVVSELRAAPGSEEPRSGVHATFTDPRPTDVAGEGTPRPGREDRAVVTAEALARVEDGERFVVEPGARITPLAAEEAARRGIRFVAGRAAQPVGNLAPGVAALRVAVASDHGGFALKGELLEMLREAGHHPRDLGPRDAAACDYPDYAAAVARDVAAGRADLGVVVDGAGIGSAMAANKVPGVLAANCWDERTARNAREHNHANVLTLGAGHLDRGAARAVLTAFLATPVGPGRHARRVDKIRAVEAEHARAPRRVDDFDPAR